MTDLQNKLVTGEPVYVQILDERRKGSIGRLKSLKYNISSPSRSHSTYYASQYSLSINDLEVVWDGRKNSVKPFAHEIEYLPNWTGGTVWQWNTGPSKPKPERIIPYDNLGQEIEPGQFVCFVHRRYGNISMQFGSVTRITDKAGVFVKTIKLKDGQTSQELKAYSASDLVIVNDKLISRLMMARLSAD